MMIVQINPTPIIRKFGRATQQDIADAVGVTRPTVSEWLRGKPKVIQMATLEKFADACGVEPGEFFVRVNNGNQRGVVRLP